MKELIEEGPRFGRLLVLGTGEIPQGIRDQQNLFPPQESRVDRKAVAHFHTAAPPCICKDGKMIGKICKVTLDRMRADAEFA